MDIKRGKPPAFVERELVIDMNREEVLTIITSYIKKRLNTNTILLDEIEIVGDADGKLESITLGGIESVPITWKENNVPPVTTTEAPPSVSEEPAVPPAS